jgi:hypothetical protein
VRDDAVSAVHNNSQQLEVAAFSLLQLLHVGSGAVAEWHSKPMQLRMFVIITLDNKQNKDA